MRMILCTLSMFVMLISCSNVESPTNEEAEEALWKQRGGPGYIDECAALMLAKGKKEEELRKQCDAKTAHQRAIFRVRIDSCNEGASLPIGGKDIPNAVTCTLSVQRKEGQEPKSRIVVLFKESERWNAIPL